MDVNPLQSLRRVLFPILDRVVPSSLYPYFVASMHQDEYAGVVDARPAVVRRQLRKGEDIYQDYAAAQRRLTPLSRLARQTDVTIGGDPVLACGSFAVRRDGRFGEWQSHIRLVATADGRTAIFAHHERTPIAHPMKHLDLTGFEFGRGIEVARDVLSIDDGVPLSELTLVNETMGDTNTDQQTKKKQKRTAAKKQAVLGLVAALAPIVVERLLGGIELTTLTVVDQAAALQGGLGVVAVAALLVARYVYEVEQLPDEVNVGLVVRVTSQLGKLLAR